MKYIVLTLTVTALIFGPAGFHVMAGVAHSYYPQVKEISAWDSYAFWVSVALFFHWCRLVLAPKDGGN